MAVPARLRRSSDRVTAMPFEPVQPMPRHRAAPAAGERSLTSLIRCLGAAPAEVGSRELDALFASLRVMAARQLRKQRPSHTLQPTALVNEAFLRMFGKGPADFADRHHFFKTAAAAMRTAIVDHERRRRVAARAVEFDPDQHGEVADEGLDMVLLDDCLSRLQAVDPEMVQLVELRVFSQCSERETAAILNKSLRTVQRSWSLARGFLRREFQRG